TPIANRDSIELEQLPGFFVNTLVLRTDLAGNPTFSDLLQRLRATTLDAYMHQDVPFEKLVERLQPERDTSRSPLFQVLFSLQNVPATTMIGDLTDITITSLDVVSHTARYDLSLVAVDSDQGIGYAIEYNTDLFDQSTIERMSEHWQMILEEMVAQPRQRIQQCSLLTNVERTQLLTVWNTPATPYPQAACLHQLFAIQASRTPLQQALVLAEQSWSYQELDQRSNQLA